MKQLIELANLLKINNKDKEIRTLQLNFFESLDNQQKIKWGMHKSHNEEATQLHLKFRTVQNLALQELEFLVDTLSVDQKNVLQKIKDTLNFRKFERLNKKFKEKETPAVKLAVEPVAEPSVEPVTEPSKDSNIATEN